MCRGDLPRCVLQNVRIRPLQHAGTTALEARGMFAKRVATTARLDPDQLHVLVLDELIECPDGVRAAAHASDDCRWKPPFSLQDLLARFLADYAMEVAHHRRVGMRSQHTP